MVTREGSSSKLLTAYNGAYNETHLKLGECEGIRAVPLESRRNKKPREIYRFSRGFLMWAEPESNRRHMDFQSIALPAELSARVEPITLEKSCPPVKPMRPWAHRRLTAADTGI